MSHSSKRSFGSSSKASKAKDVILDYATAQRMLPLVQRIVEDLVEAQQRLSKLEPESENLDRHRHDLVWAERERRYHIQQELVDTSRSVQAAIDELNKLGLSVVDTLKGRIGFPTRVNGKQAVYSWQPGEDQLQYWNYLGEETRRAHSERLEQR